MTCNHKWSPQSVECTTATGNNFDMVSTWVIMVCTLCHSTKRYITKTQHRYHIGYVPLDEKDNSPARFDT